MALSRDAIAGLLVSQFTANQVVGSRMPALANAISTAVFSYMFTGQITAAVTGTLGAGVATGITLPGLQVPAIESSLLSQFVANGIVGQYMPSLARSIAFACGTVVSTTTQAVIPIAGVGIGAGTGTLVAYIPATLTGLMVSQMTAFGFVGAYVPAFSNAVGVGFGSLLNGQQMVLAVAGNPSPVPSAGTGISVVF